MSRATADEYASILTPVGIARARHEMGEPLTREEAEALFLAFDRLMDEYQAVKMDRDNLRVWVRAGIDREVPPEPLRVLPQPYRPVATGIDADLRGRPAWAYGK